MSNQTPEELARAAGQPGVFSFVERLRGRGYPQDAVAIYLNETVGYELEKLEEEIKAAKDEVAALALEVKATELRAKILPERYVFNMHGISNREYDDVKDAVEVDFPYEYDESKNPFTGEVTRVIIPSEARDEAFTVRLWSHFIDSVEDASGAKDDSIGVEFVVEFRALAPLNAITRVAETVNKLRMATDWIDYIEDEDFFPKP